MIYVDWIVKKEYKKKGKKNLQVLWDVFLMLWTLWGLGCDNVRQLLPPTIEVLHATDRKLRQSQGPSRSLGILQDPNAPSYIMCRAFPTTLKGPARIWFSRLTPNSISTFKDLSTQFALHFIGGHRYKKSIACLMSIRQWEDETLRSYIAHFNKEVLSINKADDKILVATFTNRLRKGKFLFYLYKNDPKTCWIYFTGSPSTWMLKMRC